MSDMYAIKTSTLTALGDAIRSKTNMTRLEPMPDTTETWTATVEAGADPVVVRFRAEEEPLELRLKLVSIEGPMPIFSEGGAFPFVFDENNEAVCPHIGYSIVSGYHANIVADNTANTEPCSLVIETTIYHEVSNTMTPLEMAEEINAMAPSPTDEELTITGDCSYRFGYGGWDWVIEKYGDKITTKDISNMNYMFNLCEISAIPFEINSSSASETNMSYMFSYCGISTPPKMNNIKPKEMASMFANCTYLTEVPADFCDTWDWSYLNALTGQYNGNQSAIFNNCGSLRSFPMTLFENGNPNISNSYSVFYNTFNNCYALDEIVGMPNPHYNGTYNSTGYSGLIGSNFVKNCHRLKNFTFREMPAVNWANQTLDLSQYVGRAQKAADITNYSGIGTDKQVVDDATYQALKNDPDYWTIDLAYGRFNHDSAVATINSLPSAIDYQTTSGKGANIVKFQGKAGSATDGGAINTLTDEEIAVATAKGWTVSLL